jgi:hypothetical protein
MRIRSLDETGVVEFPGVCFPVLLDAASVTIMLTPSSRRVVDVDAVAGSPCMEIS